MRIAFRCWLLAILKCKVRFLNDVCTGKGGGTSPKADERKEGFVDLTDLKKEHFADVT